MIRGRCGQRLLRLRPPSVRHVHIDVHQLLGLIPIRHCRLWRLLTDALRSQGAKLTVSLREHSHAAQAISTMRRVPVEGSGNSIVVGTCIFCVSSVERQQTAPASLWASSSTALVVVVGPLSATHHFRPGRAALLVAGCVRRLPHCLHQMASLTNLQLNALLSSDCAICQWSWHDRLVGVVIELCDGRPAYTWQRFCLEMLGA